jgi:hypothetical protein
MEKKYEVVLLEWANLPAEDVGVGGVFARELLATRDLLTKAEAELERDRWIPVSERLPEEGQGVIARSGLCEPCYVTFGGGKWYLNEYIGEEWDTNLPTHWMPLPAREATE